MRWIHLKWVSFPPFLAFLIWFAFASCSFKSAHAFDHGVFVGNETNVDQAVPVLQRANINCIRLWADIDWNSFAEHGAFQKARDFKAQGFKVTLLLHSKYVPRYDQAKRYFEWVSSLSGMRNAVDQWEILNEVNLRKYWLGTASQYVNQVLKPAWDTFSPLGETVIGASTTAWQAGPRGQFSYNTHYNQALKNAGYLNYVDYANIHPYTEEIQTMKTYISNVRNLYNTKPITSTEWNFKSMNSWQNWGKMINEVYPFLRSYLTGVYYYRLLESPYEGGWPGLFQPDYTPQHPFYTIWSGLAQ